MTGVSRARQQNGNINYIEISILSTHISRSSGDSPRAADEMGEHRCELCERRFDADGDATPVTCPSFSSAIDDALFRDTDSA